MVKLSSEKYNILLIILIFLIPLIALDSSFYFITKYIDFDSTKKEQEKEAIQEAKSLAIESNFNNEFSIHFREFFDTLQNIAKIKNVTDNFLINHLKAASDQTFEPPFPKSHLYVFRIPLESKKAELIYHKGSLDKGKALLCKTFEHLYSLNNVKGNEEINKNKQSESLAKNLLGKYTDINAIGQEMRGITTNTNGIHGNSWFIWDYTKIDEKGIFGVFLFCDEINDYAKYGRLLALKKLKSRAKAIGAFIPVYKEYSKAIIPPPLDKSKKFNNWIEELTIKEEKDLNKWLIKSLPQAVPLGNYSAFCHLERGDSHIAVVLVKTIKINLFPKWLIVTNFILVFNLLIILYNGLAFGIWPNVNLKARFIISYALASIVPLSLVCVTAYGYIHQYEKTSVEQAYNQLQKSLKEFDSYKLSIIKDYRTAFTNIIKDPKVIELINNNDIKNEIITKTAVEIFENKGNTNNYLPIIGIKIYDETGEGSLATGTASTFLDTNSIFDSFDSTMVNMLREEIQKENIGIKLKDYYPDQEKELANNAYKALSNRDLKEDIYRLKTIPIPRKNGDYCNYFIFDTIKIDGKSKYMLFLIWDDKTLDERIIKRAFLNNSLKNKEQSFLAYKIKGQNLEIVGKRTRHATEDLIEKTTELARQSSHFKKLENHVDNKNIIVVSPAFNFNQIIFVGWIDKIDIIYDITKRKIALIILIVISLFTLWICSLRSSSTFLRPITSLKTALDEVSLGNLNIGFKDTQNNEFGKLSNEFSKMVDELREKERLSKLISDHAVQALKEKSSNLLNDTETIKGVALVSDIRNFTGMSEKNDPTIITELLNEHFAEMAKIISDNGGLIYKFIGDAIEAVFPEKEEFEKTASERAFQASCMMITKLKQINARREKIGLFPYRIGVGLCYGTMYSGSVGSIETRLDYSIIGDPLKNAAKFEALTIQNPDFPLTLDEIIAEKMASLGLGFKKIDTKDQNFNVYTLNEIGFNQNQYSSSNITKNTDEKKRKNENGNIKLFSLSTNSPTSQILKNLFFYSFLIIFISSLITFSVIILYNTTYKSLKTESDKEAIRLNEQLECNDVLKSCFEYVCLDFYEDLNKTIKSEDNPKALKETIEQIDNKYTNKGYPIPYYCCCLLKNNINISKGFTDDACNAFLSYATNYKKYYKNKDVDNLLSKYIKKLMGPSYNFYSLKSVFLRRSSLTSILNKEMLLSTEIIYDKEHKEPIAYIFCGMPQKIKDKNMLPHYYTVLAGKQIFMAINSKNGWSFSEDFPQNEKKYFIQQANDYLIEKGYYTDNDNIEINFEPYKVYSISKDLFFYHKDKLKLSLFTFTLSLFILSILFIFIDKSKIFFNNSISRILRKDIILSALIPLLTVSLVFNLYSEEDFNANKSDLIQNLNNLMNEVESREYYYSSLCEYYLKKLPTQEKIGDYINKIIKCKGDIRDKYSKELSNYLKENILGRQYKYSNNYDTNPYFVLKELCFIGKDGWILPVTDNPANENNDFGKIMSKAIKAVYFGANSKNEKASVEDTEGEIIAEKLMKNLSSGFGNDFSIKIINFPNNFIILSSSYASIGIYLCTYPNVKNPEYIIFSMIFFEPEIYNQICSNKNSKIPYKKHLESGSLDDELYCFYSPNINVGDFFELGKTYDIEKNEFNTIKELGLVSSWINTSYIPISKKVNLEGKHFLEAKQGNIIKDNVFAAIASEYPLHKKVLENVKTFLPILLFSLIMIILIAQSIISDLLDPVKILINGAGAVSKGNYKFRTNFSRNDELGILCDSFDKMMKGLEEKQLMNRMVSKTALKVASNQSDTESKKVDVALLYVTVPNFDKIMKNMSPYELFSKLRQQIAIISEIVINNGGDIDKIMGEKLLIAFHLGDKTANEVVANATKVAALIKNCNKLYFKVSVGVNFGEVISGYLGVGEKRDFTIIGDPVNVAARIAVFAEKLDNCLISETIYKYISKNISAKLYGEVELKGKSEPMKVYKL